MTEHLHLRSDYSENQGERASSALLGHALRVLSMSDLNQVSTAEVIRRLWPPILLKQVEFLYDSKGIPVAFATWAFVDDLTRESLADPRFELHLSEWNAGNLLCLMDLVASGGHLTPMIRRLRRRHAKEHRVVVTSMGYLRQRKSRVGQFRI
jgi:hemolysin-activating ACP:hemolysin acyltransferase